MGLVSIVTLSPPFPDISATVQHSNPTDAGQLLLMEVSVFSCLLGITWPIGSNLLSLGLSAWGHSFNSFCLSVP